MTTLGKQNEKRPVLLVASGVILLAALRIYVHCLAGNTPAAGRLVYALSDFRVLDVLILMLVMVLWMIYRRWLAAATRERELRRILSSMGPDVILVISPSRTILSCNGAIAAMFGYEPGEIVGQTTDFLYSDRRVVKDKNDVREALESVGFHVGYAEARRKSGATFSAELVTGRIVGQPGAVIVVRDLTERERAQAELVRTQEQLKGAVREKTETLELLEANYAKLKAVEDMKDRLTHMIVHDLKAPVSTIGGYLDMLRNLAGDSLSEDHRKFVDEAWRVSGHVKHMIMTLLDISRLEKEELPLNLRPTDVVQVVHHARELVGSDATHQAVRIESSHQTITAVCDADIVCRVIVNLIDNAARFSPPGAPVVVRVGTCDHTVSIDVIDRGPGIPPEHISSIFEPFAQVHRHGFCVGLGLTFSKLAVEAHGGRLNVASEPGKGSTFEIQLPVKAAA